MFLVTNSEQKKGPYVTFRCRKDMKVSRFAFSNKEKITVKRTLLVLAAAILFLNTFVGPTVAHADGTPTCTGACRP